MIRSIISLFVLSAMIIACSKNALTGKGQFTLLPESELQTMATTEYQQFLSSNKVVATSNNRDAEMVRRVGQRITKAVDAYYAEKGMTDKLAGFKWEYNLVDDKAVNAWCMPGVRSLCIQVFYLSLKMKLHWLLLWVMKFHMLYCSMATSG